jgi:small subunit ribosomal protein S7
MFHGKKRLAESLVYESFDIIKRDTKKDPLEIFEQAIGNITPQIEVRPRRVGGVNYQVPTPVPEHRQQSLAIKWLVSGARSRRSKEEFAQALADEIMDAYKKTGFAFKKKEDVHKMAEANKAFAHFQW